MLNVMAIHDQCHTNVGKQRTLLDGVDVGPPKWPVCGLGLKRSVHEGMNNILIVKFQLRTRSGNLNTSKARANITCNCNAFQMSTQNWRYAKLKLQPNCKEIPTSVIL